MRLLSNFQEDFDRFSVQTFEKMPKVILRPMRNFLQTRHVYVKQAPVLKMGEAFSEILTAKTAWPRSAEGAGLLSSLALVLHSKRRPQLLEFHIHILRPEVSLDVTSTSSTIPSSSRHPIPDHEPHESALAPDLDPDHDPDPAPDSNGGVPDEGDGDSGHADGEPSINGISKDQ